MGPANQDRLSHDETSPLLPSGEQQDGPRSWALKRHKHAVFSITIMFLIIVDFAGYLQEAPRTDILEGIICKQYYQSKDVEALDPAPNHPNQTSGYDCTIRPVQSELALVNEMLRTISTLPGIFLGIPYGILADRIGRRPVLTMAVIGACLQDVLVGIICRWPHVFPVRLVWLAPISRLVGGGDAVGSAMIYLVVSDTHKENERSTCFLRIAAALLLADITATPLSAYLMTLNSWIPYILSLFLSIFGGAITLWLLPETLKKPRAESEEQSCGSTPSKQSLYDRVRGWVYGLAASEARDLFANKNIVLMLFSFFTATLGRQSTGFQLQYVRQRFEWTYAKASLFVALRGSVTLVLLLAILPYVNGVLNKRNWTSPARDLFTSRVSFMLLALGSIFIAIAPHPIFIGVGVCVLALGSGVLATARSLVTSMVEETHTGALYAAIGVMSGAGGLSAGPLLAVTFRWGLSLGRVWSGIPFLFVAGLFSLSLLALCLVRLGVKQFENEEQSQSLAANEEEYDQVSG